MDIKISYQLKAYVTASGEEGRAALNRFGDILRKEYSPVVRVWRETVNTLCVETAAEPNDAIQIICRAAKEAGLSLS